MLVQIEVDGRLETHHVRSLLVRKKGKWVPPSRADLASLIWVEAPKHNPRPIHSAQPKVRRGRRKFLKPEINTPVNERHAYFKSGLRELYRYMQYLGDTPDAPSRKSPLLYTGRSESKRSKH
jgi:hypothetical protein